MSNHEQNQNPDENDNPYVENFWEPADDRQQYPRTREDAEIGITEQFKDELASEPNVVGRARHEPTSDKPLEDISALPEISQEPEVTKQSLAAKIAGLLGKLRRHDGE